MRTLAKYLALAVIVAFVPFACMEAPDQVQGPTPPSSGLLTSALEGTEELGEPEIDIEPGTKLAAAGVGLRNGPASIVIDESQIPDDATIKQVLLYWEGYNEDESGDPDITAGGYAVTGDKIGGTTEFWPGNWSTSYRADITSLGLITVDGANSVLIDGMDFNKPNGAGILVIYDDGSANEVAGIRDGNDLAYWRFDPPLNTTEWVDFDVPPSDEERTGKLILFAGSAEARPSVVEVDCGAGVARYIDVFQDNVGEKWDTPTLGIIIPEGCASISVRVLSERDDSSVLEDENPVSIAWVCAALEVPIDDEPAMCRMTGGCNDKFDTGAGNNVYTCGGQAGAPLASQPQPWGEWTHTQKRGPSGSFTFHAGTASAPPGTEIDWIVCTDPGWCRQARPAPAKQIDFAGVGTFKNMKNCPPEITDYAVVGETFHWFEVNVDDLGEPGKAGKVNPPAEQCDPMGYGRNSDTELADCECPDFYRITIHQGADDTTPIMYEVYGYIDGGNFQIHPPTGRDRRDMESGGR